MIDTPAKVFPGKTGKHGDKVEKASYAPLIRGRLRFDSEYRYMKKSVEEIYDSIEKYIGYLQKKKVTAKQLQAMLFTLLIEYDNIPESKRVRDTKMICKRIINGKDDKDKKTV